MPQIYLFLIILNNINGVTNVIFLKSKKKKRNGKRNHNEQEAQIVQLKREVLEQKKSLFFRKGIIIIAKCSFLSDNYWLQDKC